MRFHFSDLLRREVNQPYTSAVIVTRPIGGGLEYRTEFGGTLNGGEPEYGFRPGHIAVDDLTEVHLVKGGHVVRSLSPEQFGEVDSICEAASLVEPAEQASTSWRAASGETLTVTCSATELKWRVDGAEFGYGTFGMRLSWLF